MALYIVEGLNIINLYAVYDLVTGTEYVVLCIQYESKKGGKDKESIQLSTTPDPEYQNTKWESNNHTI